MIVSRAVVVCFVVAALVLGCQKHEDRILLVSIDDRAELNEYLSELDRLQIRHSMSESGKVKVFGHDLDSLDKALKLWRAKRDEEANRTIEKPKGTPAKSEAIGVTLK